MLANGRIQILQRIFPAGGNIWDSLVTETSSIGNVKWAYTWSINASLFLHLILFTPEERLKVNFPLCLKRKISTSEADNLSSFRASFQLNFGENVSRYMQQNRVGEFWFVFAPFKRFDYFSEDNGLLYQNSKVNYLPKTNPTKIKNSRHSFLEKGVKKTNWWWSRPPAENQLKTNLIDEPLYFR